MSFILIGGLFSVVVISVIAYFIYTRFINPTFSIRGILPNFIKKWLPGGAPTPPPPTGGTSMPSQQRNPLGGPQIDAQMPSGTTGVSPVVNVTKSVVSDCPPCNCECPKYEQTNCDKTSEQREINYLKSMSKFLGAIARRENAINMQYSVAFPGYSVLSAPAVQQLNFEYNYLKNEYRKDKGKWDYFKNYFTKLSGIPSKNYEIVP